MARSSRSRQAQSPNKRRSGRSLTRRRRANAASTPATAPGQPESFVFPVTVALDEASINADGATIPLTPGMTGTVEIKTDSRRVIDYVLSPLAKIASEAARER